jgi:hypothetical protein
MMADYDPIHELRKLGYTEREAAFLYLIGIHSGYFMRRQYLTFIDREDGAMVQRFLEKLIGLDHARPIEYAAGRHTYHLKSKLIYRILGQEDSQNRRTKGDRQIKARLMQVDYLLDHFGEQFLETSEQKVRFFRDQLKILAESLPQARHQNAGSPVYFPDRLPISVEQEPGQSAPSVSFAFIDDGLRSISAFVRFLEQHAQLLAALHRAEVIYTADNSRNFAEAERQFLRRFPPSPASKRLPYGVDHFLAYLRIRTSYDRQRGGFSMEEMRILRDGMESYSNLWHEAVLVAWESSATNEAKVRAGFEPKMKQISIKSYLLAHDYPVWSMKYRRAVL